MTTKDHEDATIIRIQKLIRGTLARKSLLVSMPEYSAFIFRKRNRDNYGPKIMYDSSMIFDDFANELRRHKLKNTAKNQEISNTKIEEKVEDSKDSEKKSEENVTINDPEINENQGHNEEIVNNEENFKENLEEKKIVNNEGKEATENCEKTNPDYLNLDKLNEVDKKSIQGISVRADYSPDSSRRDSVGSDIDGVMSPELSKYINAGDINTSRHKDILNSDIEGISDIEKEEIDKLSHDKSEEKINENEWQEENFGSDKEECPDAEKVEIAKNIENKETENLIEMAVHDEKPENQISDIINEKDGTSNAEKSQNSIQIEQVENETGGEEEIANGEDIKEENGQNENDLIKEKERIEEKSDIVQDNISEIPYKDSAPEEEKLKINEENIIAKVDNSEDASEMLKNKDLVEFQDKEQQIQPKEESIQKENEDLELLEDKEYFVKNQLQNRDSKVTDKMKSHENIEKEEAIQTSINDPENEIAATEEIAKIDNPKAKEKNSNRDETDFSIKQIEVPEEEKGLIADKDIKKDNENVKKEEESFKNKKAEVNKDSPKENNSSRTLENKIQEVDNPNPASENGSLKENQENNVEVTNVEQNLDEKFTGRNSIRESTETPIIKEIPRETKSERNSDSFKKDSIDQLIKNDIEIKSEKTNRSNSIRDSPAQKIEPGLEEVRENDPEKEAEIKASSKDIAQEIIKEDSSSNLNNFDKKDGQQIIETDLAVKEEAEKYIRKSSLNQDPPYNFEENKIDVKNEQKCIPENEDKKSQESSVGLANSENGHDKSKNNTAEISAEFPIKSELASFNEDPHVQSDTEEIKKEENPSYYCKKEYDSIQKEPEDLASYKDQENIENRVKSTNSIKQDTQRSEKEVRHLNGSELSKNEIEAEEKDSETIYKEQENEKTLENSNKEKVQRQEGQNIYEKINLDSKNPRKKSIKANISISENKHKQERDQNIAQKYQRPALISSIKPEIAPEKRKEFSTTDNLINRKPEETSENQPILENKIRANSDSFQIPPPKKFDSSGKQPFHRNFQKKIKPDAENKSDKEKQINSQAGKPSNPNTFEEKEDGSSYLSDKSINVISSRVTPIQSAINSIDLINPLWSQSPNEFLQQDPDSMLRKNFYPNQELRSSKNPILPHLDQTPTLTKKRSPKSQEFFENHPKIPNETTNFSSTPAKFKSRSLNQTHYHANPYNNEPADLNFDPNIYKTKKSKTKNSKELDDITNPKLAGQSKKSTSYGKYRFQYNIQPKSTTNVLVLDKGSPYELERGMKILQEFFGVKVDIVDNNHKKKIRIIKPKLQNIRLPAIKTKKVLKKGNLIL